MVLDLSSIIPRQIESFQVSITNVCETNKIINELLHFDIAVDVFGSNPMIKISMGTKIPSPLSSPKLPKTTAKNPMTEPTITLHPNSKS